MSFKYKQYKKRLQGKIYGYGNASHAFYDVMVWIQNNRPRKKPNIVMPVYIPAKLYRFVLAAGFQPVFYDVNSDFGFDANQVAGLIDDQTQAVFAVHYFGIPAPVKELKALTKKAKVFLIEDCAHTLNSRFDGTELGTAGDCAIFSIRKMMQLSAGGFLVLNNPGFCKSEFRPTYKIKVRSFFTAYHLMISRMKYAYFAFTKGHDPLNLAWVPRTGYINFSEQHNVTTRGISHLSEWYLKMADLDKIAKRRRFNYEFLLNVVSELTSLELAYPKTHHESMINGNGIKLGLKSGITPYCFPVITSSEASRSELRELLREAGIGCGAGWPEAPFHHHQYTRTKYLSQRLLELPVHQGITIYQLQRMAVALQSFEASTLGAASNRKKPARYSEEKNYDQYKTVPGTDIS